MDSGLRRNDEVFVYQVVMYLIAQALAIVPNKHRAR